VLSGPSGIPDEAPTAVLAVRLLAQYKGVPSMREAVVEEVRSWMEDPACQGNPTVQLVAGIVHCSEGNWGDALKACRGGATMEQHAVSVQAYLGMERVDKAAEEVARMEAKDDDHLLTQLCVAWVGLESGGRKVQEAAYIFQELGDRFLWSAQLHVWRAVAKMRMGKFDDADEFLQVGPGAARRGVGARGARALASPLRRRSPSRGADLADRTPPSSPRQPLPSPPS